MKLVFATNNLHKLKEVQEMLSNSIEVLSLKDIGCFEDIEETESTLEGNAKLKADYITKKYGFDCFADDTGLEVETLDGEPGVYSARYAGAKCNTKDNIEKLLRKLENKKNRNARFKTVIALIVENKIHTFEGIVEGEILKNPIGKNGFGYDSIFSPSGYNKSFAELTLNEKNLISHRSLAIKKLINFIS